MMNSSYFWDCAGAPDWIHLRARSTVSGAGIRAYNGEVVWFQVSIDGFRRRAGGAREEEGGEGPFWGGGGGGGGRLARGGGRPPPGGGAFEGGGARAVLAVARCSGSVSSTARVLRGLWRKWRQPCCGGLREASSRLRAFPQELSGLYTPDELAQDPDPDPSHTAPPAEAAPEAKAPGEQAAPARAVWIQEMIHQFGKLKARLGPEEHVYYSVLSELGVQHCNQFKNYRQAAVAYRQLEARVRELEGAANLSEAEIEADLNDEMWQDPEATT